MVWIHMEPGYHVDFWILKEPLLSHDILREIVDNILDLLSV